MEYIPTEVQGEIMRAIDILHTGKDNGSIRSSLWIVGEEFQWIASQSRSKVTNTAAIQILEQ